MTGGQSENSVFRLFLFTESLQKQAGFGKKTGSAIYAARPNTAFYLLS